MGQRMVYGNCLLSSTDIHVKDPVFVN